MEGEGLITLDKRSKGQFIGWASLLRAGSCETVQASIDLQTLLIPSEAFVRLCKTEEKFLSFFSNTSSPQEAWTVGQSFLQKIALHPENIDSRLKAAALDSAAFSWKSNEAISSLEESRVWHLSTTECPNNLIGEKIEDGNNIRAKEGLILPLRAIGFRSQWLDDDIDAAENPPEEPIVDNSPPGMERLYVGPKDLLRLGILEHESVEDRDRFPALKGRGVVDEGLAILQMVCMSLKVPFR